MKHQFLSRNVLKFIAIISMLIDHVGKLFFPDILILQIIGRLSFPIFAFFIAEGFYFTKNKLKYFLVMLIFAIVAQIPYNFLFNGLNILFTFCCALILLFIWNISTKFSGIEKIVCKFIFLCVTIVLACFALLLQMDYAWYGILLPFVFYVFRKHKIIKFVIFALITILFVIQNMGWGLQSPTLSNSIQLCSLLSILLLAFYNDTLRNNNKYKYLFYVFYPLHLTVLLFFTFM